MSTSVYISVPKINISKKPTASAESNLPNMHASSRYLETVNVKWNS